MNGPPPTESIDRAIEDFKLIAQRESFTGSFCFCSVVLMVWANNFGAIGWALILINFGFSILSAFWFFVALKRLKALRSLRASVIAADKARAGSLAQFHALEQAEAALHALRLPEDRS